MKVKRSSVIYLITGLASGVIVYADEQKWVGEYRTDLVMEDFTDFNGTVELSND